jgi:hypothetical protein
MKNQLVLMVMSLLMCGHSLMHAALPDSKNGRTGLSFVDPMPSAPPFQEVLYDGDSNFMQGSFASLAPAVITGIGVGAFVYCNGNEQDRLQALLAGTSTTAVIGAVMTILGACEVCDVNKKRRVIEEQGPEFNQWLTREVNKIIGERVAPVDQEVQESEQQYNSWVSSTKNNTAREIEIKERQINHMNSCFRLYPKICKEIVQLEQKFRQTAITDEDHRRAKEKVDSEIKAAQRLQEADIKHERKLYNVRMKQYREKCALYAQMTPKQREKSEQLKRPEWPQKKHLFNFFSDEMKRYRVDYAFSVDFDRLKAENALAEKYANERLARIRKLLNENEGRKEQIEHDGYNNETVVRQKAEDIRSDIVLLKSRRDERLNMLLSQYNIEVASLNEKKGRAAQKTDEDEHYAQNNIIESCNDEKKSWYTGITFGGIGSMFAALAVWVGCR